MKINQNIVFVLWISFFALFVSNCNNQHGAITPPGHNPLPPTPSPSPSPSPSGSSGYFYGNFFQVQNAGMYEKLLESCKRCGTRRLITNPWGGTTYERHYTFRNHPKRCRNWNSRGYIQLEFSKKQLPAEVKVSIQPLYTTGNPLWGEPFELTSTANPINSGEGFQILLTPQSGLGGMFVLEIISEQAHPAKHHTLDITVTYGGGPSYTISGSLSFLKQRAVKKAVAGCNTYTN